MRIVSKKEAQSLGLTRFFTGVPCKRGHLSERKMRGGACIECIRENYLAWNARNPGVSNARSATFREQNPEHISAIQAEWRKENETRKRASDSAYYKANVAKVKARAKAWGRANPECGRSRVRNRRARLRGAVGQHTQREIDVLLIRQRKRCAYCRVSISRDYEVDHIVPVALGGGNDIRNIQLTCLPCNRQKSAKHPIAFARETGRLL